MSAETFVDRRARELASDPTLNVALEASAGTGKTRVLVDRYVHLVEEGSSPSHILAITFTRKAAGEMKTRILEELRKRPELWSDLRNRLFDLHVTTIDAFCLGLLREFPLEAGLDPDLGLLDQVETERLLEEAIADVLAPARRGHSVDLRFLIARFGEGALERGLRDFLKRRLVKAELLSRYVDRVAPRGLDLEASLRRISEALKEGFRGEEGVSKFLDTAPPGLEALRFSLRRATDPERVTPAFVDVVASYFLTAGGDPRKRLSPIVNKTRFAGRGDYERHRDQVLGLAPLVARAHRQWLREKDLYAVREIEKLYRAGARRFAELKEVVAGLDFTDVLVEAVELLERRGEFSQSRYRLESRYHHLLIDEFQDTNEVQFRLVTALIDSWGEGAGLVQEAILDEQAAGRGSGRIREPSLFIVGDRKQSIYGFRDARVEVLEKASRQLLRIRKGGGQRLTLRHSFRAGGELLAFLNDVFAELPKARRDLDWSFQYREADHFPVGDRDSQARPVALAVADDIGKAAALVADEAVRLLEEEGRRPKDIAILFRSRASYRVYEEALSERGVPAYVYRGLGFFDSAEVRDVQALVRFLAEPGSELRAAELARSRLVGVSDAALVRLASGRRRGALEPPLSTWLASGRIAATGPVSSDDEAAFERAARLAPAWLRLVDRISPAELIERALRETDYGACFVHRAESWENVKKILELVRRAENRGYLTLSRLADYLESAATDEESPAALEAVDAVNLMTIHAAKGLEFDSVFLVNLHQRTREDTSLPRIREHPDGRLDVSALASLEQAPAGQPSRVDEEEKRLLYVALTRARRNLTLATVVDGERAERTILSLLPDSLRATFREALASEAEEVCWGAHPLRVLRPSETRRFLRERPTPEHRLRLDPMVTEAPIEGAPTERDREKFAALFETVEPRVELEELLASGRVHRNIELTVARGPRSERLCIACLVVAERRVTLVDVAAAAAGDARRQRLRVQLEAVAHLFPEHRVEAKLFSPESPPETIRRSAEDGDPQLALF